MDCGFEVRAVREGGVPTSAGARACRLSSAKIAWHSPSSGLRCCGSGCRASITPSEKPEGGRTAAAHLSRHVVIAIFPPPALDAPVPLCVPPYHQGAQQPSYGLGPAGHDSMAGSKAMPRAAQMDLSMASGRRTSWSERTTTAGCLGKGGDEGRSNRLRTPPFPSRRALNGSPLRIAGQAGPHPCALSSLTISSSAV